MEDTDGAPLVSHGDSVEVQGTNGVGASSINMSAHAKGVAAESIRGQWKRLYRDEQLERAAVQGMCAKHVKFGVPSPPKQWQRNVQSQGCLCSHPGEHGW